MGCFYVGFDYKNRKNGYLKIGQTGYNSPARRFSNIRKEDCFQCLGYIVLENESEPARLKIESDVRWGLSLVDGLTHTQNDHFLYAIASAEEKYAQAQTIADYALDLAKKACDNISVKYTDGTQTFKRAKRRAR